MGFDYGVDEREISCHIGNNIKLWPTEGEHTALVDADAIAYVVGYTSDLQSYLKLKRYKNWKESQTWKDKCDHANYILNKWVDDAKCDSALLYLTDGATNFRLKIGKTKEYKGQRIEEKPPFFYEIREWLLTYHKAHLSNGCEADDDISIEAWSRHLKFKKEEGDLWTESHKKFSDFVVVSGDKDLAIIPGWHCPPDGVLEWHTPLGDLKPIWKEKEITAYEYWPTFNGNPIDPRVCFVYQKYGGKLQRMCRGEVECPKDKWEMDYVWFRFNSELDRQEKQDTYIRGKNKGKGKFKRVKVGKKKSEHLDKLKGSGLKFFYSQLLTGDTVDNYPGLPGCGKTKAYRILDDARSELELYDRVHSLYIEYYGAEADERLLEQGQLAHMQTRRDELWSLPRLGKQTFPA